MHAPLIGRSFDGTLLPFTIDFFLSTLAALAIVLAVERDGCSSRIIAPSREELPIPLDVVLQQFERPR
ncbi:hypothetical protein XH94_20640 [Bradyrhizobium zhanjiangense]|uniref:Uncharacterized protein n=1 Tax=Bradyrhizobium zhanjiangense TaxID=1325107 RepID=A0A4Q0SM31_9BRAD|nr:hypothetical protein XH94_20640 [Bradyrhizobium zhanjiangense]